MTKVQQTIALIDLYLASFQDKYEYKPLINRHKYRWAFADMIDDLGYKESMRVIEFYFETPRPGHPIEKLVKSYERLHKIICDLEADEEKRRELRQETEIRVKEWNANNRTESS